MYCTLTITKTEKTKAKIKVLSHLKKFRYNSCLFNNLLSNTFYNFIFVCVACHLKYTLHANMNNQIYFFLHYEKTKKCLICCCVS